MTRMGDTTHLSSRRDTNEIDRLSQSPRLFLQDLCAKGLKAIFLNSDLRLACKNFHHLLLIFSRVMFDCTRRSWCFSTKAECFSIKYLTMNTAAPIAIGPSSIVIIASPIFSPEKLGWKDSNLRMPEPKPGALPTWRHPNNVGWHTLTGVPAVEAVTSIVVRGIRPTSL
jgi:hypothetical protein